MFDKYISWTIFVLLSVWCSAAHAFDPEIVRQQAKEILKDPSYQKKLLLSPEHELKPQEHTDGCGGGKLVKKKKPGTRGISFFMLLGWLGAGLAFLLVATWLAAYIHRNNLVKRMEHETENKEELSAEIMELAQAQHLASLERFVEAIHRVFQITVLRMAEKRDRTIYTWMTSRELEMVLPVGKEERKVFSDLVNTVETGLFAGKELDKSDYDRCLRHYQKLVGES